MNQEYIITEQEIRAKGLNLSDYTIDDTINVALINRALDIAVTRCCQLYDNISGEDELELAIDTNEKKESKIKSFKKLQYEVLWRLIMQAEDYPVDVMVDTIISHELNLGKINGYQKGLYHRMD